MDIVECQTCKTRVVPKLNGICPACSGSVDGSVSNLPNPADFKDVLSKLLASLVPTEEIVLRKCMMTGFVNCFWGILLLGLGILWMIYLPREMPAALFGIFLTILGASCLLWGLSYVVDRLPQLSLISDGILDHRATQVLIPWSSITGASLYRETSNYVVTRATIDLKLATPINGRDSIVVQVANLDRDSAAIFEIIRRRAHLS